MVGKRFLPNFTRCDRRVRDFFHRNRLIMGQRASRAETTETMVREREAQSLWGNDPGTDHHLDDYLKKAHPPPYGQPPPAYSPAPVNPNIQNLGPKAATEVAALQWQIADEEIFVMGHAPCPMQCYHCGYYIVTVVRYHRGFRAHLCSCLMCCSLCLMPFFWLPYIKGACKDIRHYCPVCHMLLGTVGF